jgi:hypothetical protein
MSPTLTMFINVARAEGGGFYGTEFVRKVADEVERLAKAEQLLSDLYWYDWNSKREREVREFLGVIPDGPRPVR